MTPREAGEASLDPGLLARISRARSETEINALLREGEGYKEASDRTRNRWAIRAKKRREELAS